MSNLKRITDAHAELKAGKLAMHVCIPYSLAAELAKKADAYDAFPMDALEDLLRDYGKHFDTEDDPNFAALTKYLMEAAV